MKWQKQKKEDLNGNLCFLIILQNKISFSFIKQKA
jgi:hypothetical protein